MSYALSIYLSNYDNPPHIWAVSEMTDEAPRSAKKKHRRAKSNLESQVCDQRLLRGLFNRVKLQRNV